jgi:hypothetical protein
MACRTLPLNCAPVPILTKYTGTPASEQTKWFSDCAAAALLSMMRSVWRAVSLRSALSMRCKAAVVSGGTKRRDRSYRFAVTVLTVS